MNIQGKSTVKGVFQFKSSAGPVAASVTRIGGFAVDGDRNIYVVDATAGLPAGTSLSQGMAFTSDGRLCITTAAPAVTAIKLAGLTIRADGALHIVTGAVTAPNRHAGRAFDSLGRLHAATN